MHYCMKNSACWTFVHMSFIYKAVCGIVKYSHYQPVEDRQNSKWLYWRHREILPNAMRT
jgi:hypothetical protein